MSRHKIWARTVLVDLASQAFILLLAHEAMEYFMDDCRSGDVTKAKRLSGLEAGNGVGPTRPEAEELVDFLRANTLELKAETPASSDGLRDNYSRGVKPAGESWKVKGIDLLSRNQPPIL